MELNLSKSFIKRLSVENLQVIGPHLLQLIKKIVKSGFVTSRWEPVVSKGLSILPDK